MQNLTFGEQVKIILSRKGMTIKELAEIIEARTGKKMSRQNLTQRLGRDNFQEQDMRMIAGILGCPFYLSIMEPDISEEPVRTVDQTARVQGYKEKITEAVSAPEPIAFPAPAPAKEPAVSAYTAQSPLSMENEWKVVEMRRQQKAEQKARMEKERAQKEKERAMKEAELRAQEEREKEYESMELSMDDAEEVDMTIGELYQIHEKLDELEEEAEAAKKQQNLEEQKKRQEELRAQKEKQAARRSGTVYLRKNGKPVEPIPDLRTEEKRPAAPVRRAVAEDRTQVRRQPETAKKRQPVTITTTEERMAQRKAQDQRDFEPVIKHRDEPENLDLGELNPYTGHEYQTNSVRMHPSRIGYVQMYDRKNHKWTDMTEWAFLGFQERKKKLLGKDYEPPIYLD